MISIMKWISSFIKRYKLKGIHFGSYWMKENDIVCLMALDLKDLCNLIIIDTNIYSGNKEQWFIEDYSYNHERCIRWLDENKVLELVRKEKPNFVVINAGGMSLTPNTIKILRDLKVVTIGISLSDPDVFPENGKIYSEYYDIFYTNSQYALKNLYSKKTNIRLLPFAASHRLHRPLYIEKIYDVVVVGHARPERIKIIYELKQHFNVGLFGHGWGSEYKPVHGEDHVKAINSGKIYLSFSKTMAGYTNIKVGLFEAMACRTCIISEKFDEMETYFKYGIDILGYEKDEDLVGMISFYIKNSHLREKIAENSYQKLLNGHTWTKRWENILDDIDEFRMVRYLTK